MGNAPTKITLNVNHVERTYLLQLPNHAANSSLPVVIFLHGTGSTAEWALDESGLGPFADRHGIVVVVPQGLPPDPSQPPKFIANPASWNAGGVLFPGHTPDDLIFFDALFNDLPQRAHIDASRIYVTGFSNGASMCFELAATLGDHIAAIAPVAGYCRTPGPVARPIPTLYVIGTDDPLVPPGGGTVTSPWTNQSHTRPPVWESIDQWARLIGCSPPRQFIHETGGVLVERFPGPVEFSVMTVDGLGHHWPGGRGQLKRKLAGEPSDRIDANTVIWEFCRRHALYDG